MTTLPERISVIETKIDAVSADVAEIKASISNLDNRFAAKWVQTALAFAIGLIVAAVITALVALVVGPIRNATTPIASPTPTPVASPQASTGESGDKTVVIQPSNPSGSTQPSISPIPSPSTQPTTQPTNTQTDPGLIGNVLNLLGL